MKPSLKKYWPALAVGIALAGAGLWAWPARRDAKPTVPVDVSSDPILDRELFPNGTITKLGTPNTMRALGCRTPKLIADIREMIQRDPRHEAELDLERNDFRFWGLATNERGRDSNATEPYIFEYVCTSKDPAFWRQHYRQIPNPTRDYDAEYVGSMSHYGPGMNPERKCFFLLGKLNVGFALKYNSWKYQRFKLLDGAGCTPSKQLQTPHTDDWPW